MRSIVAVTLLAILVACSSTRDPGAPADAAVERAPSIPLECVPTPSRLEDVAGPDCDPCTNQKFAEGATCSDVPIGLECEVGDHPAWECNDVWRCDESQQWTKAQERSSDRACSRDIFVGGACEDQFDFYSPCYLIQIDRVACLTHKAGGWSTDLAIRWNDHGVLTGVLLDRNMRLGCPCKYDLCYRGAQCIDGRYRRFDNPKCPPPP